MFGEKVDLGPDVHVAEVIARPSFSNERILVDDAADWRVGGRKEWAGIAIDGRDGANRAKDLRTTARAHRQRSRVIDHVGRSLFEIELGAVGTERPTTRPEDFCGRNEPQSGVAPEGRDGGANLLAARGVLRQYLRGHERAQDDGQQRSTDERVHERTSR